ncbi:MAG: AAA family ATPase, partial [Hyphomicrobium sp.]
PKLTEWTKLSPATSLPFVRKLADASDDFNIGIVCGKASGVAVVDVDAKATVEGCTGRAAWKALTAEHGKLPRRVVAFTPGGGFHLVFRWTSLPFNSSVGSKGIAPGIDLRSGAPDGSGVGQVVIAPSARIIDGERVTYQWDESGASYLPTSTDDLPEAPEWLAILACFKPEEREFLHSNAALGRTILDAPRVQWRELFDAHRVSATRVQSNVAKAARVRDGSAVAGLDHPYVTAAINGELEAIRSCLSAQNAQLNASAFSIGTVLGGLGHSAGDDAVELMTGAVLGAAMDMPSLDARDPWDSKDGRSRAKATIASGLLSGLKEPRDLSGLEPVRVSGSINGKLAAKFGKGPVVSGAASIDVGKRVAKTQDRGQRMLQVDSMDEVLARIEPLTWLWRDYLPCGKMINLVGPPKTGKSQIAALLAAHVTTGCPWPWTRNSADRGKRDPGSVVILAAEDQLDVLAPRLQLAKCDLSKVKRIAVKVTYDDSGRYSENLVSLVHDAQQLDAAVARIGDVKLIIIDPIMAYLGEADSHKNSDVRNALAPLQAVAEKYGATLLCVTHRNKSMKDLADPLDAITGSGAFGQAARGNIFVGFDEEKGKRFFKPYGSNYAPVDTPAISFEIVEGTFLRVRTDDQPARPFEGSFAKWGEIDGDVDTLNLLKASGVKAKRPTEQLKAAHWLRERLDDGKPLTVKQLVNAANAYDISERTLKRAAHDLLKVKVIEPRVVTDPWTWQLGIKARDAFDATHRQS